MGRLHRAEASASAAQEHLAATVSGSQPMALRARPRANLSETRGRTGRGRAGRWEDGRAVLGDVDAWNHDGFPFDASSDPRAGRKTLRPSRGGIAPARPLDQSQ